MKKRVFMGCLVVPKGCRDEWRIGKVIGMSRLDLSVGPLLKVKDIINGKVVEELAINIDKLVIEKSICRQILNRLVSFYDYYYGTAQERMSMVARWFL